MKNILKFCEETGFNFQTGEIGFGRGCVGIVNSDTDSYVSYQVHDSETYETIAESTAGSSENAYHKSPNLSVLTAEISAEEAIQELDEWIGRILEKGYKVIEYEEKNSLSGLMQQMQGGSSVVKQKAVVDKEPAK